MREGRLSSHVQFHATQHPDDVFSLMKVELSNNDFAIYSKIILTKPLRYCPTLFWQMVHHYL